MGGSRWKGNEMQSVAGEWKLSSFAPRASKELCSPNSEQIPPQGLPDKGSPSWHFDFGLMEP